MPNVICFDIERMVLEEVVVSVYGSTLTRDLFRQPTVLGSLWRCGSTR